MLFRRGIVLFALLSLLHTAGANSIQQNNAAQHIQSIVNPSEEIKPDRFYVCFQYGCKTIELVSIDSAEWKKIIGPLVEPAASSGIERVWLSEYIARIETIVGRSTDTQFDLGGTFIMYTQFSKVKSRQMDCIDESTNTLTYLKMLDGEDRLRWHSIVGLVTRGGLLSGYPHTAVLIKENDSNKEYVVDSWFFDNGRPPVIVPYPLWKAGWKPAS